MGNMSYCRFENTLKDLEDCDEHLDTKVNSKEEHEARKELIKLCISIASGFENEEDVEQQMNNLYDENGEEE
jgi:hypothetical protein